MKKLIVMACAVFSLSSQAQLTNGLVICMPMDNSAADFSGNANNGTLFGTVTGATGHTGLPNTAYSFNNSYINVPTSTSIDQIETNNELSVSVWCKVTGWHSSSRNFPVVERYKASTDDGWQLNLFDAATYTGGDIGFGNGLGMLGYYDGTIGIAANTWVHVVMVYSQAANTCKYYLNGYQMYTSTLSSPTALFNTSKGDLRIGYSQAGVDEKAVGYMDDLRVYDRVLTPGEIYSLFADNSLTCSSSTSTVTPPPSSGCCLGNGCNKGSNPLASNYEIPMNNFLFNFSGDGSDKVNVGYSCGSSGIGKLNGFTTKATNANPVAGYIPESISIYGKNLFVREGGTGTGVMGEAVNTQGTSVGVWGNGKGLGDNFGGRFFAGNNSPDGGGGNHFNIGVSGVAFASTGNPPAYSYLTAYPSGANIGVYGAGDASNTRNPGPSATPGMDWAGWFDGDVNIVGSCFQNLNWQFSDKRLKKDIKGLEDVTAKIQKLNAYSYAFRTDEFKKRGFDTKTHIGFLAQEVKEVFPELITQDAAGYYAVDYQGMIPVLLQALKEQAAISQKQQQQINALQALVSSQAGSGAIDKTGAATAIAVNLGDKNVVVLDQNVPNPFAESTVIRYNIPSGFTKAQIIFTDESGVVIKAVDIKEEGQGSLNVFANDLSHGVYSYSLVIDGKVAATKKMVKD